MSLQDLNTVLRVIPKLTSDEIQKVRQKLKASFDIGGGSAPRPSKRPDPDDYLYAGCLEELRRRGLLSRDKEIFSIPDVFYSASAETRKLLETHTGKLRPVEFASLGQFVVKLLAELLEERRKSVTQYNLLANISKVPDAIDRAYPGYLEAGMLSFCWK